MTDWKTVLAEAFPTKVPEVPTLIQELRDHDWYYQYSDDIGVWRRGQKEKERLTSVLTNLGCPYLWWTVQKAVNNLVVEDYRQDHDGSFYKQEWRDQGWNMAQPRRSDLITSAERDEIWNWLNTNSKES